MHTTGRSRTCLFFRPHRSSHDRPDRHTGTTNYSDFLVGGIVIAVVVVVLAGAGVALFCWRKNKSAPQQQGEGREGHRKDTATTYLLQPARQSCCCNRLDNPVHCHVI